MEAKVDWKGRLTFTGTADSGFSVPLGAKTAVGGDDDGFRPMELIALGLAGCTAMDVMSILRKKRQDVTDFEVQVHVERAQEHEIEYFITGHGVDETAVLRAIGLSANRYCPAQAMFNQVMTIELKYHIFNDEGAGKRSEITSGICVVEGGA